MLGTFTLFGREIGFYGIAAAVGILLAGFFSYRASKRRGLDENKTLFILLFSAIGVLIGGHLLYGLTNVRSFHLMSQIHDWDSFVAIISYLWGGQVFYGGLLGGIAAGAITAKIIHAEPLGAYTDVFACAVPLFHCFGRIGCFLGGCCYGVEWEYGITFHHSVISSANGVSRFPVQLVEAAFNLLLFFFLWSLLRRGALKHCLFLLYLPIYAVGRFVLEFFRGDTYRGLWFGIGISTSQIISLLILAFSLVFWLCRLLRRKRAGKGSRP